MTKEELKQKYKLVPNYKLFTVDLYEHGKLSGHLRARDLEKEVVERISCQQMDKEGRDFEEKYGKMIGDFKGGYKLVKN